APPPPAAAVSGAPSGPLVLATGSLRGIGHRASGPVSTYRLADGAMVVRFEGVDIENAPDPLVYLVPGAGRTSPGDGVRLGALKASRGSFGFQVPAGFDTRSAFTVLVWCGKFATPIATTTQAG
ncbi:MAG: DM13 domain-containing protein, partial [Actinomycetota bacterium]|nr:DM13 domain-containing protein [Actinomycetota bacterium]